MCQLLKLNYYAISVVTILNNIPVQTNARLSKHTIFYLLLFTNTVYNKTNLMK